VSHDVSLGLDFFGVFIGLRTVVIVVAAYFMNAFHRDQFDAHVEDLAITGIFERVRHPMYLGIHLFYLGLAIASFSQASIRVWLIIFAFNNTRANYEEKKLEERFGDEFLKFCILWLTLISAHSIITS
jgi:protein-S-isoprenylcysteine O-methyltransferase Ste14